MIHNYHADAFEWLPKYRDTVEMILTDVPYNLTQEQKVFLHDNFTRICPWGTIAIFSPPENQWIQPADQYLFWIKPISTKNTSKSYSRFVEMIFLYGRQGVWNNNRHWSQYTNVFWDLVDDKELHSFRKPPSLIERLILNHTNAGDTILDPFAGSFVVADVARRYNRNCISIEKDNDLYEKYGQECPDNFLLTMLERNFEWARSLPDIVYPAGLEDDTRDAIALIKTKGID